jgi:hypothetical protein
MAVLSSRGGLIPEPLYVQRGTDLSIQLDFDPTHPTLDNYELSARIYSAETVPTIAEVTIEMLTARSLRVTIPVSVSETFKPKQAELEILLVSSETRIDNPVIGNVYFLGAAP